MAVRDKLLLLVLVVALDELRSAGNFEILLVTTRMSYIPLGGGWTFSCHYHL